MQIVSRGFRIRFRVHGHGPAVLLLHEFGGSGRSWSAYLRRFSDRFTLVSVDALGHGESDRPHDPGAYRLADRMGDFVAVLDVLEIDRAHVWGYSMGGRNAWGLLACAPERVSSLIVGGAGPPLPGSGPEPDYLEARADALQRGDWPGFWKVLSGTEAGDDAGTRLFRERFERDNDPRALAAVSLALRDWPDLPVMTGLPASCHYAGSRDGFLERVKAGARVLGGTLHVIDGVGHEAHFRSVDEVAGIVHRHLALAGGGA